WKNWDAPLNIPPNQDLVSAIHSQDDPDPNKQNAASCIVFDEVLMTCLAAHGILSAEVTLRPPVPPFTRGPDTFVCRGWNATGTNGQGNPLAPPGWGSHWITDVSVPAAPNWKLYDPSYGPGPTNCVSPGGAPSAIDIRSYEPLTVATFDCVRTSPPPVTRVAVSRNPNPLAPPHLTGTILWTNK